MVIVRYPQKVGNALYHARLYFFQKLLLILVRSTAKAGVCRTVEVHIKLLAKSPSVNIGNAAPNAESLDCSVKVITNIDSIEADCGFLGNLDYLLPVRKRAHLVGVYLHFRIYFVLLFNTQLALSGLR